LTAGTNLLANYWRVSASPTSGVSDDGRVTQSRAGGRPGAVIGRRRRSVSCWQDVITRPVGIVAPFPPGYLISEFVARRIEYVVHAGPLSTSHVSHALQYLHL